MIHELVKLQIEAQLGPLFGNHIFQQMSLRQRVLSKAVLFFYSNKMSVETSSLRFMKNQLLSSILILSKTLTLCPLFRR